MIDLKEIAHSQLYTANKLHGADRYNWPQDGLKFDLKAFTFLTVWDQPRTRIKEDQDFLNRLATITKAMRSFGSLKASQWVTTKTISLTGNDDDLKHLFSWFKY